MMCGMAVGLLYLLLQSAGITGKVEVDGEEKKDWKMFSFEFKSSFIEK